SDPQATEGLLQGAAVGPQASDWAPPKPEPGVETQESPKEADHGASVQAPTSVAPPLGPEIKIQAQRPMGAETGGMGVPQGDLAPEARGPTQEGSEPSLCVQLEEQESPGHGRDLLMGHTEATEQEQRMEEVVRAPAQPEPQQKSGEEPGARERLIPGEVLAEGSPEQEALREEVARLRREAEALGAELEAQARRLE
ncbi:coiled-coil domain-containing protein 88B, partial [Carlito syrichta]|uniref:Coiled-coil domain-containing protein 88B n=1 Tax=Carlito syrichta TaxID=1868482 RepID=A0A3Q0DK78_CARSF